MYNIHMSIYVYLRLRLSIYLFGLYTARDMGNLVHNNVVSEETPSPRPFGHGLLPFSHIFCIGFVDVHVRYFEPETRIILGK